MREHPHNDRYGKPSVAMHWITVIAMAGIYLSINLADLFAKGSAERIALKDLHYSLGLLVFALLWLRMVLRLRASTPPIVPAPSALQARLGKLVHLVLYLLMVAMPLLGWCILSARGKPVPFFGLDIPALIAPDKPLARQLRDVHELGANLGYLLIGGHAAAALFHHYVSRDNTLRRMWFV